MSDPSDAPADQAPVPDELIRHLDSSALETMRFTRLGNSGLVVSKLCFGAMTFGFNPADPLGNVGQTDANRLVERSLEAGVNIFDTADIYAFGGAEEILGKALGKKRQSAIISTKVGHRMGSGFNDSGLSRRHIMEGVDASLKRLATDYVDVYICHRRDLLAPLEETLSALDDVVRAGKARYIGFSNWPAWLAAKAITLQKANGWAPFVTAQVYYSAIGRDVEYEIVPLALSEGLGLMVWSPLAMGYLSGKYGRGDAGTRGRLEKMDPMPIDREKGGRLLPVLDRIAAKHSVPVAAVSLAWIRMQPAVSTVIVGVSGMGQLEQNLKAGVLTLDASDLAAIEEVTKLTPLYPHWPVLTGAHQDGVDAIAPL